MSYDLLYTGSQIDNKLTPAYASIHVHDNSTPQSIANGVTYIKSTAFADNGPSSGAVADASNDKITINSTGVYLINASCSITTGTNNVTLSATVFVDGVEDDSMHFSRKIGTGADVGAGSLSGIVTIASAPVDIDIRLRHDAVAAVNATLEYANLSVLKIGI